MHIVALPPTLTACSAPAARHRWPPAPQGWPLQALHCTTAGTAPGPPSETYLPLAPPAPRRGSSGSGRTWRQAAGSCPRSSPAWQRARCCLRLRCSCRQRHQKKGLKLSGPCLTWHRQAAATRTKSASADPHQSADRNCKPIRGWWWQCPPAEAAAVGSSGEEAEDCSSGLESTVKSDPRGSRPAEA